MTVARRLSAIESSLTPTQLVLRWLAEAHAYGSFEAHGTALLDMEPEELPLTRLCQEAQRAARATVRSRDPRQVDQAVAKSVRETVFRFLLVLRINVVTLEQLQKEQLLQAVYAAHLALLAFASDDERQQERHRSWLAEIVAQMLSRVDEAESAATARRLAEEQYLDGHPVLFPDAVAAWDEQMQSMKESAAMAVALADIDGVELPEREEDRLAERVAVLLADLVDWSKATALEKLGEGERALGIARGWLRAKVGGGFAGA